LDHDGGEEEKEEGVSSALSGALDRFAQFFISPLFDESMLDRELRAVDSEYLNGRTSDKWRNFQLLKHGSSKDHPFSKFGCGNYNTLTDGGVLKANDEKDEEEESSGAKIFGGGSSPREDLIRFWTDKYHAGNLRLCVVGRASLDDLQRTVEKTFGPVRSPPPGFIPNGIIDQVKAGMLKMSEEEGSHLRDQNGDFVFQTEHRTYSKVAFGPDQLGLIREVIPLIESRT
jgi:insulysin